MAMLRRPPLQMPEQTRLHFHRFPCSATATSALAVLPRGSSRSWRLFYLRIELAMNSCQIASKSCCTHCLADSSAIRRSASGPHTTTSLQQCHHPQCPTGIPASAHRICATAGRVIRPDQPHWIAHTAGLPQAEPGISATRYTGAATSACQGRSRKYTKPLHA